MLVTLVLVGFLFFQYAENRRSEAVEKYLNTKVNTVEISLLQLKTEKLQNLNLQPISKNNKKFDFTNNRWVFLNLWATWCKPCIAEMPELEELIQNPKIQNLSIEFAFASNEKIEKIKGFLNSRNFDLPFYHYNRANLPKTLNYKSIPVTYLIDNQTGMVFKIEGMQNWNNQFFIDFLISLN